MASKRSKRWLMIAVCAAAILGFATVPAAERTALATVSGTDILVDHWLVDDGATVVGPATISTQGHPAEVRLSNGRVLLLEHNTGIVIEEGPENTVKVLVGAGIVRLPAPDGRTRAAGIHSKFVVSPLPEGATSAASSLPAAGAAEVDRTEKFKRPDRDTNARRRFR